MILEKDIDCARNSILEHVGKKIKVRNNVGKRGADSKEGILLEAYQSVFLVNIKVDDRIYTKASYTYKELISKSVIITLL